MVFSKTFAATLAAASVETFGAVANEKDWLFIRAPLDGAEYMRIPSCFGDMGGDVVLLQPAVYG